MDGVRKSNVKYAWELISQFVCWEFCRNADFEGDISDVQNQTDLLQFFRDMVIKMTTKQYESDITPHEIAAKFIEELSVMASSSKPQERASYVVKLSETLKRLCPELKPAITDLLSAIYSKLFSLEDSGLSTLMEDEDLRQSIKIFSFEVYKHLPVPELIKATNSWKTSSNPEVHKPCISKEVITSRLKKEKLTRPEILKIKSYIEEDSLLKMYFDEVSYTGPGLEDFPEDVTETNNRPASSKKSSQQKTARKTSTRPSTRKAISLDDYFTLETREINETPNEDLASLRRSNKETRRYISDSDDEPEIIVEKLSEQTLKNLQVRLDRVDHQTSLADKRICMEDVSCDMPVPVDRIKKEKYTPQKKSEKNLKTRKKKNSMFL